MERFSNFGAPLVEGFETLKLAHIDEDDCLEEDSVKRCAVIDTYSLNESPMDDDDDDDDVAIDQSEEDDVDSYDAEMDADMEVTTSVASAPTTSVVADDPDDPDDTADPDDSADPDDDVDEPFTNRNVIEGFAGSSLTLNKLMNFNLLLKSILFACLFYILAHPQTRAFITKNVFKKMKKTQYLYVAMVIYVVVYYVLNLVV